MAAIPNNSERKLAIWLDHDQAIVIVYPPEGEPEVISKGGSTQESLPIAEKRLNQKLRNFQREYYDRISARMNGFSDILLFGPTDAKSELFNRVTKMPNHRTRRIQVKNATKMSTPQLIAYVKSAFD